MEAGARVLEPDIGKLFRDNPAYGKQMRPVIRQPFKGRTTEELMALLSVVATAILAVIFIAMLYFGREIFVPIALAILLSFVLAPDRLDSFKELLACNDRPITDRKRPGMSEMGQTEKNSA